MKSTLVLFFTLFTTVSFCQTDLHAEIQTLESEIKSLDKEISSLESQRDQELNAQQLLVDEKQKEEDKQQKVVDQLSDEINNLKSKISGYDVNQNQIITYKVLSNLNLFIVPLNQFGGKTEEHKKLLKFKESIKKSHQTRYNKYQMVFSTNTVYILHNKSKSLFQKIELSQKEQKRFNKLIEKGVLVPIGEYKKSYLKEKTGLDTNYFFYLSRKEELNSDLNSKEQIILEELVKQKKQLIKHKNKIDTKYNSLIKTLQELVEIKKAKDKEIKIEIANIKKAAEFQSFVKNAGLKTVNNISVVMAPLNQMHFRNGDRITESRTPQEWESNLKNKVPSFQYEDFDPNNKHIFYNVYALRDKRNLAPQGFHVMDVREFGQLNTDLKFPLDRKEQCRGCSGSGKVDNIVSCKKCSHWSETQHQYNVCRSCNGRRNWKSGYKKCSSCNGSKFKNSCSFQDLMCPLFHKPSERIITFKIEKNGAIRLTNGRFEHGDKLVVFVVKDIEKKSVYSQEYYTVGELEIMKNYLNVTKFKNGDRIKYIKDPVAWSRAIQNGVPAYCYYNNWDSGIGCIYNRHALSDRRGLIPEGWRLATKMEALYLNANLKTIPNESIDPIFLDDGKLDYRNRKIPISKPPGGRTDKGDFKNHEDYADLTYDEFCGLNFQIENDELELELLEESRNRWKSSHYQGSGYLICVRDGIKYEKPSSVEKVKIVNPSMSKRTNKKSISYGGYKNYNMSTFKELYNETGKQILNNLQISNLEGLFDENGELNLVGIGGVWRCNGELEYAFKGGRDMCGIKLKRVSKNNKVKFYGAIMYGDPNPYQTKDNLIMMGELLYDGEITLEFYEPKFIEEYYLSDQKISLYFDKSSCDLSNNPINNLTIENAGLTCFKYGSEPRFWSYNWYSEESKTMSEIQEFLDNYSIDEIIKDE